MSLKAKHGKKFTLLRGNHESGEVHLMFDFKKECQEKFGKFGNEMWHCFCETMDVMPFAAVVGGATFCAHGGIPTSITRIENLNSLPVDMPDPEKEAPAAWQVLWNDPAKQSDIKHARQILAKNSDNKKTKREDFDRGFIPNLKRGTAFMFSELAVNNFLRENGLTHVIRAHEVVQEGFRFDFDNCWTVFSSSHYCGMTNKAGCITIKDGHLIPLQIKTHDKHEMHSHNKK